MTKEEAYAVNVAVIEKTVISVHKAPSTAPAVAVAAKTFKRIPELEAKLKEITFAQITLVAVNGVLLVEVKELDSRGFLYNVPQGPEGITIHITGPGLPEPKKEDPTGENQSG